MGDDEGPAATKDTAPGAPLREGATVQCVPTGSSRGSVDATGIAHSWPLEAVRARALPSAAAEGCVRATTAPSRNGGKPALATTAHVATTVRATRTALDVPSHSGMEKRRQAPAGAWAVAGAGAGAGSPPRTVTISAPKTRAKRAATGDADAHQLPTPGDLALLGTHYVDEVVLDKHVYR